MAYASPRSANAELCEGSTDGKYRKIVMDRGGVVEDTTYRARCDLTDGWYGLHEAAVKVTPDNKLVHTMDYVPTAHADPGYF